VRRYLPEFRSSDPQVAARVTLGQLLRHTPGWLGNCFLDAGRGEDALARYVERMVRLPQLTPLGTQFFYNNSGICLAGRLIEVVTGKSYEAAVRSLVLDPLGLAHSRFFSDEIVGSSVAASHTLEGEKPVVEPSFWEVPRSLNATGGLISSVRDQLAFARFHLGDGRAPGGKRLLTPRSLKRMRSHPGPGGTRVVELDGMGVTWQLRPSSQRVRIVQHGGDWPGQHSGFMIVPDRGFALTALTNSVGGPALTQELFDDDWALRTFAGLDNLPAVPQALSRRELGRYEGRYVAEMIGADGAVTKTEYELRGDRGNLRVTSGSTVQARLAFYRNDYALVLDASGRPQGARCNFVRDAQGRINWWLFQPALYHHDR
jgi:CubicO group peptidase (beta-lactamase class C family)